MKMLAALVFVAATAATASAQKSDTSSDSANASTGQTLADQDCVRARKMHRQCVLTFGGEDVNGKVIAPDGTDVTSPGTTTFSSLIHLRSDFRAEIIASADDIL